MLTRTWIEEQGLKHVNFTLTNDGEKKIPVNIPTGWMEWTLAKCTTYNETHGGNMIAINIKDTKWMCIDIDDPKYEKMILDCYEKSWQTKSSTRKLPHLYRLRDHEDPCKNEIDKDGLGVDFKYDQMWESADGYIDITPGETAPVYEGFTVESKEVCSSKTVIEPMTDEKEEYCMRVLNNIDVSYLEDRDTWVNIMYGMRNEGMSEDAMEKVSDRATKYKDGDVQDVMKGYDETRDKTITWSTVCMYSIKSNPDEHKKITKSRVKSKSTESTKEPKCDVSTDKYLALKAIKLVDGEIVNIEGVLYVFNPRTGLWMCDRKGSHTRVMISDLLDKWCCDEIETLSGLAHDEYKEKSKPLLKAKDKVNANSGINNVYSVFCDTIPEKEIEFDNVSPYLFVWKCGKAYCFKTHKFVRLKKSDYVSMTTGYAFEQYDDDDITSLQDLYREIHFDEDTYNPYMSLCVTACIGLQVEHLIICTGGGGNGKGVVNGLLDAMLGDYFYAGAVATLQQPIKSEGANPALASMHKKRATIFTEPKAGKKLDQSTIKALTGDGKINARQLYSGDNQLINHNSIIMECNELPLIDGKMDDSITRRVVAIPFEATYKDPDDPDVLAGLPHVHPKNILYKTRAWQVQHRSALFEMVRRFAKEHGTGLLQTLKTKAYGKSYVMSSDMAGEWFRERYERVEDGEELQPIPIKMVDLFRDFKETDEYRILDRDEKKYWTKRRITDHLQNSLPKGDFKERGKLQGNPYSMAIWNWKEISE